MPCCAHRLNSMHLCVSFKRVCFDEGQNRRDNSSNRNELLWELRSEFEWNTTGTLVTALTLEDALAQLKFYLGMEQFDTDKSWKYAVEIPILDHK